jgi:hypothetical protein
VQVKRWALLGCVAIVTALGSSGCRDRTQAPAATAHEVRYELAWTDNVDAVGDGWETANDLGYRIRVSRGWVTSYSVELVECPKDAMRSTAERIMATAWSIIEGTAWAGHLSGTPNPAAVHPMQVESLIDSTVYEVGRVMLAPQAYCQLHYLVARAGPDAVGLPTTFDMRDATLHLEGSYRAAGTTTETPFTLHSASAYGQLFDHVAGGAALHFDSGQNAARVVVRRDRARMFDGVDFAHMAERQQASQILKALVDHTQIEVRADDAAG